MALTGLTSAAAHEPKVSVTLEAETWGGMGFLALSQTPGAMLSELRSQLCYFLAL